MTAWLAWTAVMLLALALLALGWSRRRVRELRRDVVGYRVALGRRLVVSVKSPDALGDSGDARMLDLSLSTLLAVTDLAPGVPLLETHALSMAIGPAPEVGP